MYGMLEARSVWSEAFRGWKEFSLGPTPGGEPLWHVARDLAISGSVRRLANQCSSGRLPGITQREAFTQRFLCVYTRTIELPPDGSFPGAACSHTVRLD